MNKAMKIIAIVVLLVTIAGTGAALYAVNTMTPQVESVGVVVTPALEAEGTFDSVMEQLTQETFTGRVYSDTTGLRAQDCSFVTYTVRLDNRGFFPAEWIALTVVPSAQQTEESRDILMMPESGAYALYAGSRGDLTATILTTGNPQQTRELEISCYVFGRKIVFRVNAP